MNKAEVAESGFTERGATIVIPTLNRPVMARKAIESALKNVDAALGIRIVVSVNASSPEFRDDYERLIREFHDRVTFISQPERLAADRHYIDMIKSVNTEYLALLADDDLFAEGFIPRAVRCAEETGAALVFGPYVTLYAGSAVRVYQDYSSPSAFIRALKFALHNEDGCVYGLFRTRVLQRNLRYLATYTVRGEPTPWLAVYPLLLAVLIDGGFATLGANSEPVWINDETSAKHAPGVQGKSVLSILVSSTLTLWARHERYVLLVEEKLGVKRSIVFAIISGARFLWDVGYMWARAVFASLRKRALRLRFALP